jgi:hypothetical protein
LSCVVGLPNHSYKPIPNTEWVRARLQITKRVYSQSVVLKAIKKAILDLQLPMQSVPITTDGVSSNLNQGEVHNII